MPKGYILAAHRSPANPKKRNAYIKLALPAIASAGGKFIAQTTDIIAKENGINERTVLVEFETLEKAIEAKKLINDGLIEYTDKHGFRKNQMC